MAVLVEKNQKRRSENNRPDHEKKKRQKPHFPKRMNLAAAGSFGQKSHRQRIADLIIRRV